MTNSSRLQHSHCQSAFPDPWPAPFARAPVDASVQVPGSKSLSNRELVLSALAQSPSELTGVLRARDTDLCMRALHGLGAEVEAAGTRVRITPLSSVRPTVVDCGLAGTVMRFLPAVAALGNVPVRFTGDPQPQTRPLRPLLDALTQLGARVEYESEVSLPFTICGPIAGNHVRIDASASSQFLSALLLVAPRIPPAAASRSAQDGAGTPLTIELVGAVPSKAHIDMTLACMRRRGVPVWCRKNILEVPRTPYRGLNTAIEPDLSNAGPFLAAAMVTGGTVTIEQWPEQTTQAGVQWPSIFERMGARVQVEGGAHAPLRTLTVHGPKRGQLRGIEVDLHAFGELVPTLAAVCAFAQTPSTLVGIAHLRGHETDRLHALTQELQRLGIGVEEGADYLKILPQEPKENTTVESYADHRMATFGAIIGLVVPGTKVRNIATTAKTMAHFPTMWTQMLAGEHVSA